MRHLQRSKYSDSALRIIIERGFRGNGIVTHKDIRELSYCSKSVVLTKMLKDNLLIEVGQGLFRLNMDYIKQCAYVVPDEIYDKLNDKNYVRYIRAKAKGMSDEEAKKMVQHRQRDQERKREKYEKKERLRQASKLPLTELRKIANRDGLKLEDILLGELEERDE